MVSLVFWSAVEYIALDQLFLMSTTYSGQLFLGLQLAETKEADTSDIVARICQGRGTLYPPADDVLLWLEGSTISTSKVHGVSVVLLAWVCYVRAHSSCRWVKSHAGDADSLLDVSLKAVGTCSTDQPLPVLQSDRCPLVADLAHD